MTRYVLHPDAKDVVLDWWPGLTAPQRRFIRDLLVQLRRGGLRACTFYRQPALDNAQAEDVICAALVVRVEILPDFDSPTSDVCQIHLLIERAPPLG